MVITVNTVHLGRWAWGIPCPMAMADENAGAVATTDEAAGAHKFATGHPLGGIRLEQPKYLGGGW